MNQGVLGNDLFGGAEEGAMGDPVAEFFDGIEERSRTTMLGEINGTIQFDLDKRQGVEQWTVSISNGIARVETRKISPDCIARTSRRMFERIIIGDTNAVAAWMRNELTCNGELGLLLYLSRTFPTPPGTQDPRLRHPTAWGHHD